ncbi:MAG: YIP1 family protein [Betaproteobacteria bacterium]
MFCSQCGKSIVDGARFCNHCGAVVAAAPSKPEAEPAAPAASAPAPAAAGVASQPAGSEAPAFDADAVRGIVARVKAILLSPSTEWPVIAAEPSSARAIYLGYVAPLAAIGVVAAFIGHSLVGVGVPLLGTLRVPVVTGLATAVVSYVLAFVGVFLISWLVDALAPTFDAQKNPLAALKVVAYAFTPAWVAGVLNILPALSILGVLAGLYGLYLLYTGLPLLMRCPPEKSIGYTIVLVLCAIVVSVVVGLVSTLVIGGLGFAGMRANTTLSMQGRGDTAATDAAAGVLSGIFGGKTDAERAKVGEALKTLEKFGKEADKAGRAGANAPPADVNAALGAVGALVTGGRDVQPVDFHRLRELLPGALPGMQRNESSGQSGEAMGIKGSSAIGVYSGGDGRITIEIADMGSLSGLAGLAAKFDPSMEKETDSGYERTRRVDGTLVHERYDRRGRSGEVDVIASDRFSVSVRGSGVDPDALAGALKQVDLGKLAALAAAK